MADGTAAEHYLALRLGGPRRRGRMAVSRPDWVLSIKIEGGRRRRLKAAGHRSRWRMAAVLGNLPHGGDEPGERFASAFTCRQLTVATHCRRASEALAAFPVRLVLKSATRQLRRAWLAFAGLLRDRDNESVLVRGAAYAFAKYRT